MMETLRESHTSLLVAAPERKSSVCGAEYEVRSDSVMDHSPLTSHLPEEALNEEQIRPENQAERFLHDYSNLLFPREQVSYAFLKRAFDVTVCGLALLFFAPIMLVVALAIRLTTKGPIVFKQVRVGRGGRFFWCYKFRSMCVDAEEKKKLLLHLNEASGPVFKIKRDPRITRIGSLIRKTSLDELPQLINILKGDMSIVGPRPPIPSEVEKYTSYERGRLAVQPGLTCLWQIGGRSNVSFERWMELDIQYIETMTFRNDIRIVLCTVPAVLKGSGSY